MVTATSSNACMTIHKGNAPQWAPRFGKSDAKHFLRLLEAELASRRLDFSGTAPHLTDSLGRQFYLGNLAELCALTTRKNWQAEIAHFIDAFTSICELENVSAMSQDVVRRSLRIRLFSTLDESATDATTELMRHIVRRPALPGTEWSLYLRRPGAGQGVIAEHLHDWGIDVDEAFVLARENTLAEELGTIYERDGLYLSSSGSLFAHAAVLAITEQLPLAAGYVVAVPNRHEVLAGQVPPHEGGIETIAALVAENVRRYTESPSAIFPMAWFVPGTGIGLFGEQAELIDISSVEGVRFGPAMHEHFADLKAA
jgi:hypothetical protein